LRDKDYIMRKFTRKTLAVSTAVVLLTGGAAYAYWTAGGSGAGVATTGTSTSITVVQTSTMSDLRPGGAAQPISGDFNNSSGSPVFVTSVTASILGVDMAVGAAGTCDESDYTLALAVMSVNATVPVGSSQGAWSGATIQFNNKPGINQDACKGAVVALGYTAL
jgi:hypothetical protein